MEWLNYHHLLYSWMVAREGSIAQENSRVAVTLSVATRTASLPVAAK